MVATLQCLCLGFGEASVESSQLYMIETWNVQSAVKRNQMIWFYFIYTQFWMTQFFNISGSKTLNNMVLCQKRHNWWTIWTVTLFLPMNMWNHWFLTRLSELECNNSHSMLMFQILLGVCFHLENFYLFYQLWFGENYCRRR